MTNEELEYFYSQGTAKDLPDERDYIMEEMVSGDTDPLPEAVLPERGIVILNQGKTSRCSLFSAAGAATYQNYLQAKEIGVDEYTKFNGNEYVEDAIKLGFSETDGWYIQSAVKLYMDKGAFIGYAKVMTDEQICRSIYNKRPICTGSNQIDWKNSRSGIAVFKDGSPGHAFFIVGYDKDWFYMVNSWGNLWGDGGFFKVKRSEIGRLFTCYSLLDKNDEPMLYGYLAKKKGWVVLEDFRPNEKATREFAVSVINKVTGKSITTDNPNLILTESTFSKLMDNAGLKYTKKNVNVLMRWEVIKAIKQSIK